MRKPEDRRCSDCDNDDCEVVKLRCALSESMFVLSVNDIAELLKVYPPALLGPAVCVHFTHLGRTGDHIQGIYRNVRAFLERRRRLLCGFFCVMSQFARGRFDSWRGRLPETP
jgi:hypothetical protein